MKHLLITLLIIIIAASTGVAKDSQIGKDDIGLTVLTSSDVWVGGVYHLTDKFAVKPSLFMNIIKTNNNDKMSRTVTEAKGSKDTNGIPSPDYGLQVALDYYVLLRDNMYMYIGPLIQYQWGSYLERTASTKSTGDIKTYQYGIRLGMQYMFTARLGIFGDMGLFKEKSSSWYKTSDRPGGRISDDKNDFEKIYIRTSMIGIVFYF